MSDYSKADLKRALERLPLEAGDVVFCHANLGFFGRAKGADSSVDLCEMFFDEIICRIGPSGTICVPTFTYSFPNGEVYDPGDAPSKMGAFSEWVRRQQPSSRTIDPCYSVAAIGPLQVALTDLVSENSFDRASFFNRLHVCRGKILNLNFDAGSTFVHHVERKLGVPYRFDKLFTGRIGGIGEQWTAKSIIWVHYLHPGLVADFEGFDALAREKGKFVTAPLGRGEIGVITADDTYDLIAETLPERPWFLTRAEKLGIESEVAAFCREQVPVIGVAEHVGADTGKTEVVETLPEA